MDKNRATSIKNIVDSLHRDTDKIYIAILEEDFKGASKNLADMEEALKHLKQNLKIDEI